MIRDLLLLWIGGAIGGILTIGFILLVLAGVDRHDRR